MQLELTCHSRRSPVSSYINEGMKNIISCTYQEGEKIGNEDTNNKPYKGNSFLHFYESGPKTLTI